MKNIWKVEILCNLLFALSLTAYAEEQPGNIKLEPDAISVIHAMLQQPDEQIDLATAKLTIDHLIDPSFDVEATLHQINRMAKEVSWAFRPGMTDMDKLYLLKNYLYEKGEWNGSQAFRYDLDDPLGTNINNKLLRNYLASRKGNCTSMPILFVVLGDKLGLDMTIALAPLHVLVKYTDANSGIIYNLEATDKAQIADNSYYIKHTPMTQQAINNGVYLAPLSKKETVAVMATILNEYYEQTAQYEKSMALADLVLTYHPNDVYAMIKKGNAYYELQQKELHAYSSQNEIPPIHMQYINQLGYLNQQMFAQAEALGWQEEVPEEKGRYLESVNQRVKQQSQTN
jgi:regulator of sirC expression with transglutaminase-like and TPR domain